MSKDSVHCYLHFTSSQHAADFWDDFVKPANLPEEDIYVPPQHQPLNPEDEDDVVPDQHAAYGIQQATQAKREAAWKDLGVEDLLKKAPKSGEKVPAMQGRKWGIVPSKLPR